jgi:transposase
MPLTQRTYTEEFRKNAVTLSQSTEKSLGEIAKELGIGFSTLSTWRKKYSLQSPANRKPKVLNQPSPEQSEFLQLKRENERLKKEVDILKKATALFAKDQS